MDDVRTQRSLFMVSHVIDVLGRAGSSDPNGNGAEFDMYLVSGTTPHADRVDIRNVAITSNQPNSYRVNFFHSSTRGGIQYTDSTYIGGLDIACASGMPEYYYGVASGVYYGNAHNTTYGQGVSCYLPYYDYDHNARRRIHGDTQYIHGTIQNLGNYVASGIKLILMYELANPEVHT